VAKIEPKAVQLQVLIPEVGFPRTMFFNRFRVEKEEGFSILSFGLVSNAGILVDSYCCVLTDEALENNKRSLLEYYGRTGEPKTQAVPWQGAPPPKKTDVVDVVSMTIQGKHAETGLVLFSHVAAFKVVNAGAGKTVPGQAVVLLRSSTDVQMQLIKALYE
jgi:hypothetical protein